MVDPELDRSLAELGFVQNVEIDGDRVRVAIRLPTFWCSPNFAYLMIGDAHAALTELPGVRHAEVQLVDHFAGEKVSEAVAAGLSFQDAFPDVTDGELVELRRKFRVKAFIVRQDPVLRAALEALGDEALRLPLGDASAPEWADGAEWAEYMGRRRDLRLDEGPGALAFTDPRGVPIRPEELATLRRAARTVRISLQSNTEFCTGLLAARYGGGAEEWQRKEVA